MPLAARQQSGLYYARKRVRDLAGKPRLFRTHLLPPGFAQQEAFADRMLSQPLTFSTRFRETGQSEVLMQVRHRLVDPLHPENEPPAGITLARSPGNARLFISGRSVATFAVDEQNGQLTDLVVALRPGDGTLIMWDQRGVIGRATGVTYPMGRWGLPNSEVNASSALLEPLSLYVNQLPFRYQSFAQGVMPDDMPGTVLEIATAPELFSDFGFPLLEGT